VATPDLSYDAFLKSRNIGPDSQPIAAPTAEAAPAPAVPDVSYKAFLKTQGIAPAPAPTPTAVTPPEIAAGLEGAGQPAAASQPTSPHAKHGWWQMLANSLERGVGQELQTPKVLGAMFSEATGDDAAAAQAMKEVNVAHEALPQPEWSFSRDVIPKDWDAAGIQDLTNLGYWFTERLGESAPALLTMMMGGGVGGVAAKLAARGMMNSASRAALIAAGQRAGMMVPVSAMGAASVGTEQFGATGSTQPGISAAAGLAGGYIQTYLPMRVLSGDFAKTYLGAAAKGAGIGGAFGTTQEAVNVLARTMTDPSYSFFSDGPTRIGWGERLFEAGMSNIALGGAMGAGFHPLEKHPAPARSVFRPEETGDQPPGFRQEETPPDGGNVPPPGGGGEPPIDYSGAVDITQPPSGGPALPKFARGEVQPGEVDPMAAQQDLEQTWLAQAMKLGGPKATRFSPEMAPRAAPSPEVAARTTKLEEALHSADPNAFLVELKALEALSTPELIVQALDFSKERATSRADALAKIKLRYDSLMGVRARLKRNEGRTAGIWPEAPPEETGATAPEPGPITNLRRLIVKKPITPDRGVRESTVVPPEMDAFRAMPLLRDGIDPLLNHEAMLDWMEANTARYAVEDEGYKSGYLPRLLTDTDLEKISIDHPQSKELKLWEIDQGSLQPAALTADIMDLPPVGHERIWFLPGVSEVEKVALTQQYAVVQQAMEKGRPFSLRDRATEVKLRQGYDDPITQARVPGLETHYEMLVNAGLRVIPSRGASFYYGMGGSWQGRRTEALATSRSKQIGFLDPVSGLLRPLLPGDSTEALAGAYHSNLSEEGLAAIGGLPVSLDLNKFKPGDVTAWSNKLDVSTMRFRPGLSEGKKSELRTRVELLQTKELPAEETVSNIRSIIRDGGWFEPSKNAEALITKEPLSIDKLTPGVVRQIDYSSETVRYEPTFEQGSSMVHIEGDALYHRGSEALRVEVAKLLPVLDGILEKLGIEGRLNVEIGLRGRGSPGTAYLEQGLILIDPESFRIVRELGFTKDRKIALHTLLVHEIGHFVTFKMLTTAPVEVHQTLRYAYNKALLEHRLAPEASELRTGTTQTPNVEIFEPAYYRTYPEWLAEQFRRWASSNEEPKTLLERTYKDVAKGLERFYNLWEKEVGTRAAQDMTEPSYHFSAALHYWRAFGDRDNVMGQLLASNALHRLGRDPSYSPRMDEVLKAGPLRALAEMKEMFPPGVQVELNRFLNPLYGEATPGAHGRTVAPLPEMHTFPLIEMALGALPRGDDVKFSRQFFAHELVHANRMMGLMHETEFTLLHRHAREAGIELTPAESRGLAERIAKQGEAEGWSPEYQKWLLDEVKNEERVAQYMERFANGERTNPAGHGIMQRIFDILRRIASYLRGEGYNTREDVLRAFFDGEMAHRPDRSAERLQMMREMAEKKSLPPAGDAELTRVIGNPRLVVYKEYEPRAVGVEGWERWRYSFYDTTTNEQIGFVKISKQGAGGHDVNMIRTMDKSRPELIKTMMDHWEQDLGARAKPSGELTPQGYQMARLRWREEMKHYVHSPEDNMWYSPKFIRDRMSDFEFEGGKTEALYNYWKKLYDKIPKETWGNPILNNMFMLPKEHWRDEVQASIGAGGRAADQGELQQSLGAGPAGTSSDAFSRLADQKKQDSQARAARESGLSYNMAAPRMPTMEMRNIVERMEGYQENPEARRKLTGTLNEADRIGKFTKIWWDLLQLLWNNEHLEGLRTYVGGIKLWQKLASHWQTRADETVRAWRQLEEPRREAMGRVLFDLAEGKYRTAAERAAGTARQPTSAELAALLRREAFTQSEIDLLSRIASDYTDFIKASEKMSVERVVRTVSDPAAQALAIAKVRQEYAELQAKPFFPMTRFGRWTIAVRDLGHKDQPVIESHAYDTRAQRDAALDGVRAKHPGQKITYGTVPEHSAEFMGLPGPLLRTIKDELPGLSPDQRVWIEEFEQLHAPDNTFRRKWLPQNGLPGYSMDAMRAHSAFFMSGANYLARLTYGHELQDSISAVYRSVRETPYTNTAKRQEILKYMQDHYQYVMEAGRDWGKTKAFVSLWQLGFSPAAAFVNLLQTPTTTLPHIMGEFGNAVGFGAFTRALDPAFKPMGQFDKAREVMQSEGLVDVGQAADLASYAEGGNLLKALAGSKGQHAWMEFAEKGMWMFQKAEQLNRVVTIKAAWHAAMENPGNSRVAKVAALYPREMADLMDGTKYADGVGLNQKEAAAYLYAKEVTEKTQFTFAKWNRPPFLRSQLAQVALIFFKYTQNMIELYRISPGVMQMALMQGALFGLAGLPGAEDLNAVMKSGSHLGIWLLRKLGINLYGKDFDLLDKAREYSRQLTQGTVFDAVGPDLFLHGISRYGFGTGLLPEGFGLGQFDASQNGSLGRIVPGLQEGLRGAVHGDLKSGVSDVAQRAAGAGYGYLFNMLKYFNEDPGTYDSKTWETLLPRAARSGARAYRFGTEGLTTKQGGRVVKFDMTDPQDFAAVAEQALGFTPTKVTQWQEYNKQVQETLQTFKVAKTMLYGQLDKALSLHNPGATKDVMRAIDDYNNQVIEEGYPTLVIQKKGLVTSIQNRIKQRTMQEAFGQGGPVNRQTVPVARKVLENYPEVQYQQRVR
jgi:hypothetical protein